MIEEKKFKDFIKLKRGYDLPNDKMQLGKIPVIASTSIKGYHNQYKVLPPVVVTGRSGSLGTVQYVDEPSWVLNTALYVKNFKGNNPKYAYYFLKMMHLENFNAGAGVPTLNQNHLHNLKIKVHQKERQPIVAEVLSNYDKLIENNTKRITILEQMAEQLYKEWFVRMRFPNYENTKFVKGIPENWDIKSVEKLVDRKRFGKTYKQNEVLEEGKVIVIDQSIKDYLGFHNQDPDHMASVNNPYLLFGDHSCKMVLMTEHFSLGENIIPFLPKKGIQTYFLYQLINELVETTEYKRHWKELIVKKVVIPTSNLQTKFSDLIKPLFEEKEILVKSTRNLKKTRDLLLPRLISGKLKVQAEEPNNKILEHSN